MPKKISECTKAHLISVPLPNHAATYTVISHQFVIDYTYQALAAAGFIVKAEEYRCTADGQIAQGIYKLHYNNDPDLSMMFAWTNSYNKQVKFKCVVGAFVESTESVMISGEMGVWIRKHMGTADVETQNTIDEQIKDAHKYYNQLVLDKNEMEGIKLDKRKKAQILGVLFAEFGILTTEQASMVRNFIDRPLATTDPDTLWGFYNCITVALQHSHPKTWMEDQRVLHYFIDSVFKFPKNTNPVVPVLNPVEAVVPEEKDDLVCPDPNQINIFQVIAEEEALVTEVEEVDEPVVEEPKDEVIIYEDPAGNTFEAPIVEAIEAHNSFVENTEEVKANEEPDFSLDFNTSEDSDDDSDSIPDFF